MVPGDRESRGGHPAVTHGDLPVPDQPSQSAPGVKPGARSSEFIGKTVLQGLLVLNQVGGQPAVPITPEATALIVGALEGLYGLYRTVVKTFSR